MSFRQSMFLSILALLALASAWPLQAQFPPRSRAAGLAETAVYFPLAVGNSWTYTVSGLGSASGPVTVRVTRSVTVGEQEYFELAGYAGAPALVRLTSDGRLVELDSRTGQERLWYDFAAPEGATWRPEIPVDCLGTAKIASRHAKTEVPAGSFDALQITYGATQCADAGWDEETFAPGIGLLRRTEITIAGPRAMLLTEARLGSKVISRAAVAFALSIDQPIYYPNLMPPLDPERAIPTLRAELAISNTTNFPLVLRFPSGQQFDLVIRDEKGDVLYRWSDGKAFTEALVTVDLSPGARSFVVEVPLEGDAGRALPPGKYTVEGWLTTTEGGEYRATVSFEMGEPVF